MENLKPPKTPINPVAKSAAASKRANILAILATLISLIALIISVLVWQQISGFHGGIRNQIDIIGKKNNSNYSYLVNEMKTTQHNLQQQKKRLDIIQDTYNQVLDFSRNQKRQLTLSEASYLIHLASLHLNVGHDVVSTQKLLQLALDRLNTVDDPTFLPLKMALNKDISTLKSMNKKTLTSLILALEGINTEIQALTLLPPQFKTDPRSLTSNTIKENNKELSWDKKLTHSLSGLKDLFIIRHEAAPISPILSQQQQLFLKENIQFKILQAEWAAINQQEPLYTSNLEQVKNWLLKYFHKNEATPNIVAKLEPLIKTNVKPEVPDISNTLKLLRETMTQHLLKRSDTTDNNKDKDAKKVTPESKPTMPPDSGVAI